MEGPCGALVEPSHFHQFKAVFCGSYQNLLLNTLTNLLSENHEVFSDAEISDFLKGWKIQNPEHRECMT